MNNYSVINLKTDPKLKKQAVKVAERLGVSISAVLNNELKRFATEQSVVFAIPELPNSQTAKQLAVSKRQIERGDFHTFSSKKESLDFLARQLR